MYVLLRNSWRWQDSKTFKLLQLQNLLPSKPTLTASSKTAMSQIFEPMTRGDEEGSNVDRYLLQISFYVLLTQIRRQVFTDTRITFIIRLGKQFLAHLILKTINRSHQLHLEIGLSDIFVIKFCSYQCCYCYCNY